MEAFASLFADITANISRIQHLGSSDEDERQSLVKKTEQLLQAADEKIEEASFQVLELPASQRIAEERSISLSKAELSRLRTDFKQSCQTSRNVDSPQGVSSVFSDHRAQLLDNSERLERASRRLDDGFRIAVETEEVGANILENLGRQRETIQRARDKIRETDNDLTLGGRILTKMANRIAHNRIQLFGIMLLVATAIIVSLYFGLKR